MDGEFLEITTNSFLLIGVYKSADELTYLSIIQKLFKLY